MPRYHVTEAFMVYETYIVDADSAEDAEAAYNGDLKRGPGPIFLETETDYRGVTSVDLVE